MENIAMIDSVVFDILDKTLKDEVFDVELSGFDLSNPRESFLNAIYGNAEANDRVRDYMYRTEGNSLTRTVVLPILFAHYAPPPKEVVDALVYVVAAELYDDLGIVTIDYEKISGVAKSVSDHILQRYHDEGAGVFDIELLTQALAVYKAKFPVHRSNAGEAPAIFMYILNDLGGYFNITEVVKIIEDAVHPTCLALA